MSFVGGPEVDPQPGTAPRCQSWLKCLPPALRAKVAEHANTQNVIGNTGWLFVDYLVRMAIGVMVNIWLTRYLGPEQFGLLSYALTFVLLFSPIAQLGLDAVLVRNLVRNPAQRDEILGSAVVLKLAGGVASCLLCLPIVILLRPADKLTLLLVGITASGTLFQSLGVIDFWFQSQLQVRYAAFARIAACLVIALVKIALILTGAGLVAFALAGVADLALVAVGLVLAYRSCGGHIENWRMTRSMGAELVRDGWLFMFSDLVMLAYMRIDKIMIGEIVGAAQLGIYAVAALVAESLVFVPVVVSLALFPSVLKARTESEELFDARMQQYYNLMVLLGYGVASAVTLVAWWLVPLMFGANYREATPMLVGLVWAGVFINLTTARSYYLTAVNLPRLHLITDLLGCLANITLNLYLIPRYGAIGAVAASLVSYCFAAYLSCFLFMPLRKTGCMMTRALLYPKVW